MLITLLQDVKASSAMELPLWLTEGLTPTRFVNAFLPNAYADKVCRAGSSEERLSCVRCRCRAGA